MCDDPRCATYGRGLDPVIADVRRMIREHGRSVVSVIGQDRESFAYTVGLTGHGLPELYGTVGGLAIPEGVPDRHELAGRFLDVVAGHLLTLPRGEVVAGMLVTMPLDRAPDTLPPMTATLMLMPMPWRKPMAMCTNIYHGKFRAVSVQTAEVKRDRKP